MPWQNKNKEAKQIVILGAGFAGVAAALSLSKLRANDKIILISHVDYTLYHPGLYEVATAVRSDAGAFVLKQTVAFPLNEILNGKKNVAFKQAWVENVEVDRKLVRTDDGDVSFDYLVIALGSTTDFYGIPGLNEHALTLKSFEDAIKIRNHVQNSFVKYFETNDRSFLNFVIGGGGFTGVELACELVNYLKHLAKYYKGRGNEAALWVVEGSPALVSGLSPALSKRIAKRLGSLGVKVVTNSRITRITDHDVQVSDGEDIATRNVFWTGGVRSTTVPCEKKLPIDKKDRLTVSSRMNLEAYPEIFVVGDCSAWLDPGSGRPLAQTAHVAIEEGKFVARAISDSLHGREVRIFRPSKDSPYIVPGGGKYAFLFYKSYILEGFWAYVLRRLVDLKYFLSILPWWRAVAYWWKGSVVYVKND